ncbi:hypothetical protein CEP53_005014 [Fusarium sp. AF-6]|nr:hypothetical protein CEP53_005014 [Fusarium sp. AF-6]
MAASYSKTDKLRLAFRFCRAPFHILAYVIRDVAIASARKLPLKIYAVCAVAKALQDIFDAHDTQSFAENGSIDMLSASFVRLVTAKVLGPDWEEDKSDRFSHAFLMDMEHPWVDKLNTLTKRMYLSVGYQEVFRDQCVEFVDKVRKANPSMELQFDLREKMPHDFILLEGEEKRNGECIEVMKKGVKGVLTTCP